MAESLVAWMVVIEAALLELLTVERRAAMSVALDGLENGWFVGLETGSVVG